MWLLLWLAARASASEAPDLTACKRLPMQSYVQHKATIDVTADLTEIIYTESNEPIEDVSLTWLGSAVHASIGSFDIVANVTLEGDRGTRCYTRKIVVTDTNECETKTKNWQHACDRSAHCVNTIGSYACACEEGFFAPRHAPYGCGGYSSTAHCCPAHFQGGTGRPGSPYDFETCVSSFKCQPDLCASTCVPNAKCTRSIVEYGTSAERKRSEAKYECECPAGLVGTGVACEDGRQPPTVFIVNGAILHNGGEMPCGCQKGVPDPCVDVDCGQDAVCVRWANGTAECRCAPGFTRQNNICVDETLPVLALRGKASIEISQCGQPYEELGVRVVDDVSAAAYERSLRIAYSSPLDFPSRATLIHASSKTPYFKRGDYLVSYRIQTPWRTPDYVETTRSVTVVDENECALPASHHCAPRCSPHASCVNEPGGYRCVCPPGSAGDGFIVPSSSGGHGKGSVPDFWQRGHSAKDPDSWRVPRTFAGGTGCTDTEPPEIVLVGPNPITLRTERCVGHTLLSRYSPHHRKNSSDDIMPSQPSLSDTDAEVAELVDVAPEALCGGDDGDRRATCAQAYDIDPFAAQKQVDLTSRIVVGKPFLVETTSRHPPNSLVYLIPYSVSDDAGNVAVEHRELILKIMTLDDVQAELETKCPPVKCPKCPAPQPYRKCGNEGAERRLSSSQAEIHELRQRVEELQAENTALDRQKLLWLCTAILAGVIASILLYVSPTAGGGDTSSSSRNDAAAPPPATNRSNNNKQQPLLRTPVIPPPSSSNSATRRTPYGSNFNHSYQTPPSAVRGTPRQSPYSAS